MLPYGRVYNKGPGWESVRTPHQYLAPEHNDTETRSSLDDRIFYTSGKGQKETRFLCLFENIALHLFQNRVRLSPVWILRDLFCWSPFLIHFPRTGSLLFLGRIPLRKFEN